MEKVRIVGAGPGDPELLTIKGRKALEEADLVLYAGSLINHDILSGLKSKLLDSSGLTHKELVEIMVGHAKSGEKVVRLHDGDPSIYGALQEEIEALQENGVDCEIIPGVSSLFASAAAMKRELTIPGVSQTVVITRVPCRTGGSEGEFVSLLRQRGTFAIFLSSTMIERVVELLLRAGRKLDERVALVYRASWSDERVLWGELKDLPSLAEGIGGQGIIFVGDAINSSEGQRTKLYDEGFSHSLRRGNGRA
jgi:precorrin-4/cobalt-precorrin-4 C11-methyltransferase